MDHDITEGAGVFNNSQIQELRPWEMRAVSVSFPLSWDCPRSHLICSETFAPPSQFKSFANFCVINLIMHPKIHHFHELIRVLCLTPLPDSWQSEPQPESVKFLPSFSILQTKGLEHIWIRICLSYSRNRSNTGFLLLNIGYFVSHELNQGQITWAR